MTPDLLHQLRDIHEPATVSWWPLAIGWWLLLSAVLIVLGIACYYFIKRNKRSAAKREALLEIENMADSELAPTEVSAKLSQLIRRLIRHYYPEKKVSTLTGDAWKKLVIALSEEKALSPEIGVAILSAAYAKDTKIEIPAQCEWVKQWVNAVF